MVFAAPTARNLPVDWLELVRWCLTGSENAGSRQWKAVRAWLLQRSQAATLVSYSDPSVGHTGALYRACGWLWAPTWHRLFPIPTGNGSWKTGSYEAPKDRWIFPLRPDANREAALAVKDTRIKRIPWAEYREPKWKHGRPVLATGGGNYRKWIASRKGGLRMRVSFWPLYSPSGASSRLRVYTLHEELLKMGIESVIAFDPSADVSVVQKHRDPQALRQAAKAKFLVYDFDDTEVAEVMPLIRDRIRPVLVTTDTEGHRHWAAMEYGLHPVVIPDPVDYGLTPIPPSPDASGVCWFGHSVNFTPHIRRWLEAISGSGIPVTLISDGSVSPSMDGFRFLPWRLDTFVASLRQSAVCILSHEGQDPGKSPNKMITAITAGVPCVVSDTPEYGRLAREMAGDLGIAPGGLGIAADPGQAVRMATAMVASSEIREAYLRQAQPWVWERYNPRRVAELWLQTVKERM